MRRPDGGGGTGESATIFAAAVIDSPLGALRVEASAAGVRCVRFDDAVSEADEPAERGRADARDEHTAAVEHLRVLRDELAAYFAGELRVFTVAVDAAGSAFQRGVWAELRRIGFGRTRSYGDVARALGKPGAARAVGLANGANPVPIVVPCHRVIGADGSLAGFSAGVERKRWLLAHEGVLLPDATIGRRRQALLGDHAGPRVG